jgi:hypothetical protein
MISPRLLTAFVALLCVGSVHAAESLRAFNLEGRTVTQRDDGLVDVTGTCGPARVEWKGAGVYEGEPSTGYMAFESIDGDKGHGDQTFAITTGNGTVVTPAEMDGNVRLHESGFFVAINDNTYLSCGTHAGRNVVIHMGSCLGTGCSIGTIVVLDGATGDVVLTPEQCDWDCALELAGIEEEEGW